MNDTVNLLERPALKTTRAVNTIGMGVLALMMFLTAADVVLRYVFNRPVQGSLETVEFMMVIVVTFGFAYTGIRREHVKIDVFTSKFSYRTRNCLDFVTTFVSLVTCGLITWQLVKYGMMMQAGKFTSSVLYIPEFPFIYAASFGFALLCVVFIRDLYDSVLIIARQLRWWNWPVLIVATLLTCFVLSIALWGKEYLFAMEPVTAGLVGIVLLLVLLFSGMTIGMVMAVVGFLGMTYVMGIGPALSSIGSSPYSTVSTYGFSVVPLFILMGSFCFYSGLSRDIYFAVYKWIGHFPGGLAMATIGACAGFAAISGSSLATVATMGTVALPEMRKYNYDPKLSTGCIAAGGGIGVLIPPSIILVIYGIITEQSIGKLFLAGFIPGVMEAILLIATVYILCKRNPQLGPRGPKTGTKEKVYALKSTWGVLALFLLVIGGIYFGIFTPTEAAGIGAFGAFIFALGRRQLSWKNFVNSLLDTGSTTSMCFLILLGAIILGYFLAVTRLPFELSSYISSLHVSRYLVLFVIFIVYLFLGAIMSSIAMVVLTVPIFFPVVTDLGFNPIWFGIIVVKVTEIAMITPPVGMNVFVLNGIAKDVPIYTIFRGIVPFLIAEFVNILILVAVPQICLVLPNLMK